MHDNLIINSKKLCSFIRNIQHEKLYATLCSLSQDIVSVARYDENASKYDQLQKEIMFLKDDILKIIDNERKFILPYIENILEKITKNEEDASFHYKNLMHPVKNLIIKHHIVLDQLNKIRAKTNNFNSFPFNNFETKTFFSELFDFYQFYEKYIYIEENILFPSLEELMQKKENIIL